MPTSKSTSLKRRDSSPTTTSRVFYTHSKGTAGVGGRQVRSEQFIVDEDGTLLTDKVRIHDRWRGFFQTRLNKKSLKLDPTISTLTLTLQGTHS